MTTAEAKEKWVVTLVQVLVVVAMILFAGPVTSTSAAVSLARPGAKTPQKTDEVIVVHTLQNQTGGRIATWFVSTGKIAIAFEGSTDVAVVEGRTLTYWSAGQRNEVIHYHYQGLWQGLHIRFGITEAMIRHALYSKANAKRAPSPLARHSARATGEPPPVLTTVDDYGDNVEALARNTPFPIRHAGVAVLGYRLARAYLATVSNPVRKAVSGPIATVIYSTNPARLGVDDHRLTLNFASRTSQAGQANAKFLGGGRPSVKAKGIVAYKANENQIVFDVGQAIGVITSTLALADSQWKTVLSLLRAP
jgi:hypothetical protein